MDKENCWTVEAQIKDTRIARPHVLLLGAGASVAALPKGDKNGRILPVMNNFVEVLELHQVLKKHGISYNGENFELLIENEQIT